MHWHHRPFAHTRDADALLAVIRRRPAAARSAPLTLAEMQELLQLPQTVARIHLWLHSDDTVLGYAYLNPSSYLFFETIDVPHRAVLEAEMIRWGEAQLQRTTDAAAQALALATTLVGRRLTQAVRRHLLFMRNGTWVSRTT